MVRVCVDSTYVHVRLSPQVPLLSALATIGSNAKRNDSNVSFMNVIGFELINEFGKQESKRTLQRICLFISFFSP